MAGRRELPPDRDQESGGAVRPQASGLRVAVGGLTYRTKAGRTHHVAGALAAAARADGHGAPVTRLPPTRLPSQRYSGNDGHRFGSRRGSLSASPTCSRERPSLRRARPGLPRPDRHGRPPHLHLLRTPALGAILPPPVDSERAAHGRLTRKQIAPKIEKPDSPLTRAGRVWLGLRTADPRDRPVRPRPGEARRPLPDDAPAITARTPRRVPRNLPGTRDRNSRG